MLVPERCEIALNHLFHQIVKFISCSPTQHVPGFGSIADEQVHFSGTVVLGVDLNMALPMQASVGIAGV